MLHRQYNLLLLTKNVQTLNRNTNIGFFPILVCGIHKINQRVATIWCDTSTVTHNHYGRMFTVTLVQSRKKLWRHSGQTTPGAKCLRCSICTRSNNTFTGNDARMYILLTFMLRLTTEQTCTGGSLSKYVKNMMSQ